MIQLGKKNTLIALRSTSVGFYLGDKEETVEILLPGKYVPESLMPDDEIEVFIYKDSEDRLVATTLTPKIQLNECAYLQVKDINAAGIFLDWGLEKDLLLPYSEQAERMELGKRYFVFLSLDEKTDRLMASAKLGRFMKEKIELSEGEQVNILVTYQQDLGYQVIVNNQYYGLVYYNEIFKPVKKGDRLKGFVKRIREDGKIDISLQKQGYGEIENATQVLLKKLKASRGFIALTDKSDPQAIIKLLGMSKKTFKKAVGSLYKQKLIEIQDTGIALL